MSAFSIMKVGECYPSESRLKPDHYECLHCEKELDPDQYCFSDSYCMRIDSNDEEIWVDYIYHLECYGQSDSWNDWHGLASPEKLNGFELLNDIQQKKVMKSLWPYQVEKEMRPKLNLSKCIDDLNGSEIRIELERRGLHQRGIRIIGIGGADTKDLQIRVVRDRLEEYLNNEECKQMNDLLVIGYCKGNEKKNKINIPAYLQRIVLRYYPSILYRNDTN